MALLTLDMLGPFQVTLAGEPVTSFETEKARALLAYLAAEAGRPHRREVLAEMLWPGRPQGAACANLRHTLSTLRRAIDDHGAEPPFLLPTRQTIQFNDSSDARIDVATFSTLLPACQTTELVLDDLQWADTGSISLLFHLGRQLAGSRILIVGAYRSEEVRLGRRNERHPLEKVLSEFKRTYGDVWLDLAEIEEPERRRFVDAFLETEPNRLGEDFRKVLSRHTGGHPLFTIELTRAMQERGDLIRDDAGRWVEGPVLDWKALPARVEGAIEVRIGRLDPGLREILSVASVEGEVFTAQVVAQVQEMEERLLLRRLAQGLERRHRLVKEQAEVQVGLGRICRYRFGHALIQNYLYGRLSRAERRLLHGEVAAALERSYGERHDEIAVQLAHHYPDGPGKHGGHSL